MAQHQSHSRSPVPRDCVPLRATADASRSSTSAGPARTELLSGRFSDGRVSRAPAQGVGRAYAEEASAAKADFLARMSHELKTPLNAIIGFADLLHDEIEGDDGRLNRVEHIQKAGATLLEIVDDILDYARAERGAIELDCRPFRVRALFEDAASTIEAAAARKGLALDVAFDPAIPTMLVGDEARIRQACLKLLDNAIKFTPSGRVSLDVSVGAREPDRVQLRIAVTDTGIGIPADAFGRLFERFSQVDGSLRRPYGGSGLGLAMARRLVELMGGTIGVASADGQGSTFDVVLWLPTATGRGNASPS